jgi:predicted ribosome quality control (RQC) complex YloA/Tae2 family protein
MSLNWREIDLVLAELDLEGAQIQRAFQPNYETLMLGVYKKGVARTLLFVLTNRGCRLHETFRAVPKADKPLRFGEFCKSRLVNGRIVRAVQLGDDRIVRIDISRGEFQYHFYARLWSGSANIMVTDLDGTVLDAMRRLPKRGEVTGGRYVPEVTCENAVAAGNASGKIGAAGGSGPVKEYAVRPYDAARSFNAAIDAEYAEHGKGLSLDALREKANKAYGARIVRIAASLERLRDKEAAFANAEALKAEGEAVMARLGEAHIKEDLARAEGYFEKYKKAKSGLVQVREDIAEGERTLAAAEARLAELLAETNPLRLAKFLKADDEKASKQNKHKKRPGLGFMRGKWLLLVGRDAKENDELLRRHVKGADLWLHVRDVQGAYVFIKAQRDKSVPLDILLDAGNLAVFYSKARNNGKADLFYTHVKYLRRAKNGPRGLVIPTQEKNLAVTLDEKRLRELEGCRV